MCNQAGIDFINQYLGKKDVIGNLVLEVGSYNVNGSVREFINSLDPKNYVGVDIEEGPNVDAICDATALTDQFRCESFDLVIATEVIEHIRHWQKAISNFKQVLKPGGILIISTRSIGFPYHGHPDDFWRFQIPDIYAIFSDFDIEVVKADPECPGVFLKARKPEKFQERDLKEHQLYSIITGKLTAKVNDFAIAIFKLKLLLRDLLSKCLPNNLKKFVKRFISVPGVS